jgi:hypothetical protein
MDSPIVSFVQNIESILNESLGFDAARASLTNEHEAIHQFVFVPTFHSPATFVIEHRTNSITAYLALLESSNAKGGGWQDVQLVTPVGWSAFSSITEALTPWTLPHAVTESRDGMAASYRVQTLAGSAGFCTYNPDRTQHAAHIAWLRHAVMFAEDIFRSTEAVRYLDALRIYFIGPKDRPK